MPAYNAELTLRRTYDEVMEQGIVDLVVIVDDSSRDGTLAIARLARLCDRRAPRAQPGLRRGTRRLSTGSQLYPRRRHRRHGAPGLPVRPSSSRDGGDDRERALIRACWARGSSDAQRSRAACRGGSAVANRILTMIENVMFGAKLSSTTPAHRAFSRELLERCRSIATRTTSCSTTRCSPRRCGWAARSPRSRAPATTPRRRRSGLRPQHRLRLGLPPHRGRVPARPLGGS